MRICFYTETALPKVGGQEMVVDALARQFSAMGHEVMVLAPHPRRPLRARDCDPGLPYRVRRHPRFFSTRRFVAQYRRFLVKACREFRPDVLHCHSVYPTAYLAGLCREEIGVPILLTSHGGDVYENNPRVRKPVLYRRHVEAIKAVDRFIAISRFTREGFVRLGAREDRIVDIPNGVDAEPFALRVKRPEGFPDGIVPGKYMLFMGRLIKRKGVDCLLRAWGRLPRSSEARLVIAGDGDERERLVALAGELGLGERVCFFGPARGEAKIYLFQNAICTVVPSRTWEAFGLIVLESYASGRPVIASRLPGLEDLVQEGETGFLVDAENAEQLAGAIDRMQSDRERADAMGKRGLSKVGDFRWEAVARRHIEVYQSLRPARAQSTASSDESMIHPVRSPIR